jgi:DNA-binding transcriptional regulator YiaG
MRSCILQLLIFPAGYIRTGSRGEKIGIFPAFSKNDHMQIGVNMGLRTRKFADSVTRKFEDFMVQKTKTGVWIDQPPAFDGAEAAIIRAQCGLTQVEMGVLMGSSEGTVRAWERAGHAWQFAGHAQRWMLFNLMEKAREAQRD